MTDGDAVPTAANRSTTTGADALRTQVRGSTLLLLGRICSLLLNLVTQVVLVRALTKNDYGGLAYLLSLVELLSIAALIAADKTILRVGAMYHERQERPRLVGMFIVAGAILVASATLLLGSLLCFGSQLQACLGLNDSTWPLLLILICLVPANGVSCVTQSAANVVYGAKTLFWRKHLLNPLLKVMAVVLAAATHSSPERMALALAFAAVAGVLADVWLMCRLFTDEQLWPFVWPSRWQLPVREFFSDSLPVLASDIAYMLRGALLVIMLGWWCQPAATASLRAVMPVAKLNELVLLNFMTIFVPLASRLFAGGQNQQLSMIHRSTNLWVATLSFPIFAVIAAVAQPAAVLLFGADYADAAPVLILLAFAYFVQGMYGLDGSLLRVLGRMREVVLIDFGGAILLGGLACLLIPRFGAVGAGVSAVIGISVHGELRRWAIRRELSEKNTSPERRLQLAILSLAVVIALVSLMYAPGWILGGALAAAASMMVLLMMRHHLDLESTLPELRKLPGAAFFLKSQTPAAEVQNQDRPVIAYIMSRFPKLTETFVLREMIELERSGIAVGVYPLQRERAKTVHPQAKPYVAKARFTPWISASILWSNVSTFAEQPGNYLSTWGCLVRSNWGCPRYLSGAVLFFPKIVHLARLMQADGIQHIHAHFASHPAMAAWTIHRLTGLPYSFTAHGSDLHRDRHMLREKVADAAAVIAISQYNRRLILDECGSAHAGKVHVVHCGINPQEFTARKSATAFDHNRGPFRLICVGTLHEVKGQRYLLDACRQLKAAGLDLQLRFVGDGPDCAMLKQLTEDWQLQSQVEFCGAKTADEVRGFLADSDVIVAPSVPTADGRREGIPVVLMEGLACGLPAVASRLSGIPELIQDGETGLLVSPGDADGLAAALLRLANNAELRQRLSVAGCKLVQQEFLVTTNTQRLRDIIFGELDVAQESSNRVAMEELCPA